MKKIIYIILSMMLMLTSCEMFEFDNFDGPDAQISGKFIDSGTGETVQMESYGQTSWSWVTWSYETVLVTGVMDATELGWDFEEVQDWFCKFDGTYTNNLVFAGDYRIGSTRLNCYPFSDTIKLNKGGNQRDFTVTPYCRIVNPQISYDNSTEEIVATFSVDMGDPTRINSISRVKLCANTDVFVGNYFNLCSNDSGASTTTVMPGETITLTINTADEVNNEEFKYERNHYVRIAALAQGNGYNLNGFYNFSQVFEISSDFRTITEVEW